VKYTPFGILVLAGILFSKPLSAQEHTSWDSVNLTVSIFNDAEVEPAALSQARDRATEIMSRSGIKLIWLDCSTRAETATASDCSAVSFPSHLSVRIVPKFSPVKEQIFGQSFQNADGEGSYALAYYSGIKMFSDATAVSTGKLLGSVIAHEIGHLLLGTASHSHAGLMSAVWQSSEINQVLLGNLLFTGDQGKRMRVRFVAAMIGTRKPYQAQQAASGK
jgi:hypothetical protein